MCKITLVPSPEIMPCLAFKSMQKDHVHYQKYARRFLSQNGSVSGNAHVWTTTCRLRRKDFLELGWIYLYSAWHDESDYIKYQTFRRIKIRRKNIGGKISDNYFQFRRKKIRQEKFRRNKIWTTFSVTNYPKKVFL